MNDMLLEQDRINRERLSSGDFNKNFLVSAGAGAGKTYTTVERVFNMLNDPSSGIQPQDIVMITFTIKAATELKTRLSAKVRSELEKAKDGERIRYLSWLMDRLPEMQISTIHSFCKRILNDYPLESGVGFAPQYESEDGEGNGPLILWFDKAWKGGKCPECQRIGVSQEMARSFMSTLNQFPTAEPQYADVSLPENAEKFEAVLAECRRMVRAFRDSLGDTKPDIFDYRIRNALLAGDDLTDADAIKAARKIAKDGPDVAEWMGKTARKTAPKACEELRKFLDIKEDTEKALQAMENVLAVGATAKGDDRRNRILDAIPMLEDGYREVACMVETLPDKETLAALCGDIDMMIHSVVSAEICRLNREYVQERHENHVVTLSDMLLRSAELVKNYPDVRQKLHEQYRVFFVDEYQDTNPMQTELIFGIAADEYDPDWRKCVPGPGRLFLVGDAKQGIYRFTGADIALWKEAAEVIEKTGGEVLELSKNYRSTTEICDAVTESFAAGKPLGMENNDYQVEYQEMVADRGHGPAAIWHHVIPVVEEGAETEDGEQIDSYTVAAEQVAQFILRRVRESGNRFGDFLILSFYKEKHNQYTEVFRKYRIPVKFDGRLSISSYRPIELLNLRVQAVTHPFDERLSFRALCECGEVLPQEWDLFRMNVKKLPEETRLTKYRTVRDLMGHTEELRELLPHTPMNRNILRALKMLDDDRKLSQRRDPCAFLDELTEMSDGLFRDEYDAEEYQNQYAALRHIIDRIRDNNPQQFADMADMLNVLATSELDRMPTLRTDDNFVRLMNLHKAKGLQGKIMIFLPGTAKRISPDHSIERNGTETKGWFVLKTPGKNGTAYNPLDWKEHSDPEKEFLKAERTRLRYVALTRAEDEAHFFEFMKNEGKRNTSEFAWKGFEGIGSLAEDPLVESDALAESDDGGASVKAGRQEQFEVMAGKTAVRVKTARRVTPSELDKRVENELTLLIQDADGEEEVLDPLEVPGGKSWGSAVHRAAELIVKDGSFTKDAIALAARQAVTEEFQSELLRKKERENLQLPEEIATLDQIRDYLAGQVEDRLSFMMDPASPFRKMLEGAEIYTEMPFAISVNQNDGDIYLRLAGRSNEQQGKRLEVSGKIDLALRYPDGTWAIADYKTDRMLPEDQGSRDAFYARLNREYGNQLEIYRIVLEYLTGETVKGTKILSV